MPATLDTVGVATPIAAPPPMMFPSARQRLDELATWSANWDGHGAPALSPELIASAKTLLASVSDAPVLRGHRESATFPAVVPLSSGAVQLEWHVGDRILEWELESENVVHYLKWWLQRGVAVEGIYPVADRTNSVSSLEWVLHGRDAN